MEQVPVSSIAGIQVLDAHLAVDNRGSMSRLWPATAAPTDFRVEQVLVSRNKMAYTLRGMHFQRGSSAERKIVGVLRGRLVDVAVDLRGNSETYLDWAAVELSDKEPTALLLPRGIAHGFLTLEDNTEVSYLLDHKYVPEHASGIRWDDPLIHIEWPHEPIVMADRDTSWPLIDRGYSSMLA